MYTIGIISATENEKPEYGMELKAINYVPSYMTFESMKEEIPIKDAYIIEGVSGEYSSNVFEMILILRAKFRGILWIVTKENSEIVSTMKNLYFRLGVNGVSQYHSEKEAFFLQLKNSLNYSGKPKVAIEKAEEKNAKLNLVPRNRSVLKEGKEIELTRLEYKLLDLLFRNNGVSISYGEINKCLWGKESYEYYKIANLVFHVRKKIENNPSKPEVIKTVRSVGYLSDLK